MKEKENKLELEDFRNKWESKTSDILEIELIDNNYFGKLYNWIELLGCKSKGIVKLTNHNHPNYILNIDGTPYNCCLVLKHNELYS